METLNSLLRPVFDVANSLMATWPVWLVCLLWAVPLSIFALWAFKKFSNQDAISATKDKIYACLFEIRLFNDDIRAILRAQWEILGHVFKYQALSLKPMIWILPPTLILMVHLHAFYGFRALKPGEETLLIASLKADTDHELVLDLPEGLTAETPGVWASGMHQVAWRIRADLPGDYQVRIRQGADEATKTIRVGGLRRRLSPERPDTGFVGQLEWPSEKPFGADSFIQRVTVSYPEARVSFLGFEMQSQWTWMIIFFIMTMVIALALKKPMGVEL